MQLLLTEGGAAMSMRLTRGCGSLGVASHAWVVWQSRRLQAGRMLYVMKGSSVDGRLVGVARPRIKPDSKWKVAVTFVCMYMTVYTCMYQYIPCSPETGYILCFFHFGLQDMLYCTWGVYTCIKNHDRSAPRVKNSQFLGTVYTGTYHVLEMHVWYIPVQTGTYQNVSWCTCSFWYIPVYTSMYRYVPNRLFSSRWWGFQMQQTWGLLLPVRLIFLTPYYCLLLLLLPIIA